MSTCIHKAGLEPYRLPLHRPWRFATHSLNERRGWLIRLRDDDGREAWGEAAPLPEIGTESLARCQAWLIETLPRLSGWEPAVTLEQLPVADQTPPAARCGLETALLDLCAQQAELPLARWLAVETAQSVELNAAAGGLLQTTHADLSDWLGQGYRCLKFKLEPTDPMPQAVHLQDLCRELPAGVTLRLDANRAWDPAPAREFFRAIAALPVEWVEDPLRRADPAQLAALCRIGPVAPALDEGLEPSRLDEILELRSVAALVLKPMRLGGLLPALAIARRARTAGLATPVTTSLDGAIATHADLHLAAALDGLGERTCAHGLATGAWLAQDLAPPPPIQDARMWLPGGSGLGCEPSIWKRGHDTEWF